jgi:hypothetical protein
METEKMEIGVRRWKDLRVAEWLGYKQRRRIRALIHKNLAQLERHGTVVTATERPGCIEYWLNFEQTIAVCALADAPRGREVWELVVKISACSLEPQPTFCHRGSRLARGIRHNGRWPAPP